MLWTISVSSNIWKVDFGLGCGAELFFGFFSFVFDTLHGSCILAKIDTILVFKIFENVINNLVIEVFTAEVSITVGRFYFKDAIAKLKDGDIESTTTKIEDDNLLVIFLIETISESCCGRLVDNTANLEASDFTGIFGGLALRIVEVGRNRDNGFGNFFA